ncbi:HugZ family protein [Pseudogulbenkiania sp. MAI-1]|uniref:HugZ family pyridoxamine 5'-phosphate oxidase n=1 Tax=Pseudogulbenkiania sp. MAI-1 TaxID=990370 RepID=UPI00045EB31C|nr:pyridoxamine 5'-phosphate oxidase family protein [Pseudogulbenkiania sp. MAI-1]
MKIPIESALTLLHESTFGTLATHSTQLPGYPYATVVPYVLDESHSPVICISALAEHTKNLLADPRVSLSVVQAGATDVQATARATLVADAERIEAIPTLLGRYLRYEPGAEQLLSLDFMLFRLKPQRIRFIGGIGRMGWMEEKEWGELCRLPAATEADLVQEVLPVVQPGIRVLGLDCYGIDYEVNGRRQRQPFPDGPLRVETLRETALNLATRLA